MSRESQQLGQARARFFHISWILVGWLTLASSAYWIARRQGPIDAIYMTLETLAYLSEKQTGAALAVQIVLLHGGTVITWYIGWLLVDLVMDQHFWRHQRERKRMNVVERMSEHYVICGGGRVGTHLAELLRKQGKSLVIVESDADRAEALKADFSVVEGDARDESTLKLAGVHKAAGLIAALRETERNVLVVLAARFLGPKLKIFARCERPDYADKLTQAGAEHIILPALACAERMASVIGGAHPVTGPAERSSLRPGPHSPH